LALDEGSIAHGELLSKGCYLGQKIYACGKQEANIGSRPNPWQIQRSWIQQIAGKCLNPSLKWKIWWKLAIHLRLCFCREIRWRLNRVQGSSMGQRTVYYVLFQSSSIFTVVQYVAWVTLVDWVDCCQKCNEAYR
jgi:hypothetical protein